MIQQLQGGCQEHAPTDYHHLLDTPTTHVAHVPSEPQSPEPPESNRSACRRQRRACPGGEGDVISIFRLLDGGLRTHIKLVELAQCCSPPGVTLCVVRRTKRVGS